MTAIKSYSQRPTNTKKAALVPTPAKTHREIYSQTSTRTHTHTLAHTHTHTPKTVEM